MQQARAPAAGGTVARKPGPEQDAHGVEVPCGCSGAQLLLSRPRRPQLVHRLLRQGGVDTGLLQEGLQSRQPLLTPDPGLQRACISVRAPSSEEAGAGSQLHSSRTLGRLPRDWVAGASTMAR